MGSRLATIVVESRLLVREALKSLMGKNFYRVVCDFGFALLLFNFAMLVGFGWIALRP